MVCLKNTTKRLFTDFLLADTLLDLHAKLSTVVRYYDRMLEERLSNTYSQHTIGGYNVPPPQRQSAGIYPSVSSNPGAAENFYTNPQRESFGRPQSTYNYGPPQQYATFDKRASVANPGYPGLDQRQENYNLPPTQSQGTAGWPTTNAAPTQYVPPAQAYPIENNQHQGSTPGLVPSQPPSSYVPSEPNLTPSADPNAVFYYGNAPQNQPPAPMLHQGPPDQGQYPPMQSPQQIHQAVAVHQSPQQFTRQPSFSQQQNIPQNMPQQPPQQQPYWQGQPQNPVPQQNWQPPQAYGSYTQDSFPSAPHHAPQPKPVAVEESLIEL